MNIDCPYCSSNVEVNIEWAKKNGRIFCGSCCKSFEVKVPDYSWQEIPKKETIPEKLPELQKDELMTTPEQDTLNMEDFGVYWDYGSGL